MASASRIMQSPISSDKKAVNTINKMKYKAFCEEFEKMVASKDGITRENMGDVFKLLCDITKFDPNIKSYDKEKIDRIRQETGMSTYDIFQRKHYEKNKEDMDKKNAAKARKIREAKKTQQIL